MDTRRQSSLMPRFYLLLSVVSLCLWCYAVLTTSIDHVPMVNLPILYLMPATYWVGFAMLILATIVWYFSAETRWYHFSLLLFWTLYIFIGPEMMEVTARGYDAIDHLVGVTYIEQGRLAEYQYAEWPGFAFLSSFVYKVTGIGYYILPKLISTSFHLLRMVFIGYLGTRLFAGKKAALLFSVLLIGFFWEPQAFDPSPQHFGILLMLPLLGLCFSAEHLDMRRRGLIIILFTALVIIHILTSFILVLVILFFSLMSLTGRHFSYSRDIRGYTLPVLFLVMFTTYIMYTADWIFAEGVAAVIKAFREPFQATQFLIPDSAFEEFVVRFVYLFYIVLLLWMLIIVARKKFWANLLDRVFPLLCLIPVSFVIIPYGMPSLPRLYILGVPFIVWFLVKGSRHVGKVIIIAFMVILLVMSFGLRYTNEYVTYIPTGEFSGAQFACQRVPLESVVYDPAYLDPGFIARTNRLDIPYTAGGKSSDVLRLSSRFPFAVKSIRTTNVIHFHYGERDFVAIAEAFYKDEDNIIYSNGEFQLYAYRYRGE